MLRRGEARRPEPSHGMHARHAWSCVLRAWHAALRREWRQDGAHRITLARDPCPCCSASTGNTLISFILTSTSGDADLYVSNSAFGNVRPTATTPYCAFSTSDSRDVVEIWPNTTCYCTAPCAYGGGGAAAAARLCCFVRDIRGCVDPYCCCLCTAPAGTYYVGVLGWNGPATYAIVGTEVVNAVVTVSRHPAAATMTARPLLPSRCPPMRHPPALLAWHSRAADRRPVRERVRGPGRVGPVRILLHARPDPERAAAGRGGQPHTLE